MTLLALLPVAPELGMLAAILAWRAVYYAAPALIGAALAVRGPRGITPQRADLASPAFLQRSHRAEVLIHAQGEHRALPMGAGGGWLTARSAHLLIGLFDPVGAATQLQISQFLQGLATAAQARNRIAVLYKCAARTAATARSLGFAVQPIAREAWLDPRRFRLAAAARSGLRRKLRHAQSAGVSVSGPSDPGPLPFAEMDRIAAHWAGAHGGERGFSMGRYARDYVAGQRVYLARRNGRLVGFVTFHAGVSEWVLDLMRHGADLPDGSMHLLIIRAIEDAT